MKHLLLTLLIVVMAGTAWAGIDSCKSVTSASADDCMRLTSFSLTGVTSYVGKAISAYKAGWRFPNVTVSQGTVADSVRLRIKAWKATAPSTGYIVIRFHDADSACSWVDAATFDSIATNGHWTDAYILDTLAAQDSLSTTTFNDLKNAVNEVFARGGWKSGNALALYVGDSGSGTNQFNTFFAYDSADAGDGSGLAVQPSLTIYYTTSDFTSGIIHNKAQAAIRYDKTNMNYLHKKYKCDIKED